MITIKRTWRILIIILALLTAAGFLSFNKLNEYYVKSKLEPQVELTATSNNMKKAKTYRYSLESGFTVNGRKEVISRVEGEKNGENTHIKGEMVNTPVDIYFIDRTIYNYDSFSQKWLVIESDASNTEELLISELNPLSNFRFKQVGEVQKIGFEAIDGTECLVVKGHPAVESQLLESLWKDFEYQFWIDYKHRLLKKAVLTATNKQMSETRLKLVAKFYDFDKKIDIKAPDTSKKINK